jgi:hypothetical protein
MADKTLTAPLAIIEIGGVAVGKIRSLRVTENVQRGDVKGVGTLISVEKPALAINCTFTASSYFVDIRKLGTIDNPFIRRGTGDSVEIFTNTLLLRDSGVNIHLYRKTEKTYDEATKLVTETGKEKIGVIYNAYMDSQSFDINEGSISGSDLSGSYLDPILL